MWLIRRIALFVVWLAYLHGLANSHEWYPANCCSDHDCHPVACSQIERQGDHWTYLPTGNQFQISTPSPDADCHVCISTMGQSRCLFIPLAGS